MQYGSKDLVKKVSYYNELKISDRMLQSPSTCMSENHAFCLHLVLESCENLTWVNIIAQADIIEKHEPRKIFFGPSVSVALSYLDNMELPLDEMSVHSCWVTPSIFTHILYTWTKREMMDHGVNFLAL